jgi:hypothetical protein
MLTPFPCVRVDYSQARTQRQNGARSLLLFFVAARDLPEDTSHNLALSHDRHIRGRNKQAWNSGFSGRSGRRPDAWLCEGRGQSTGADFRLLPEVAIPEARMRIYRLVQALFDNHALNEQDPEPEAA